MWLQFFIAAIVATAFLFVPGYLFLRALRLARLACIGAAPAVSVAAYQIWAVVLAKAGVWADWASVSLPVLAAAALALCASALMVRRSNSGSAAFSACSGQLASPGVQWASLAFFVMFSLVVVMVVFVKNLDGPASYFQAYDNLSHMSSVKAAIDTGWYSPFGLNAYYDLGAAAPYDTNPSGFYPSGWLCIVTLAADLLNTPVALAENAVNAVFMGVALPAGACFFLCWLLREHECALPWAGVLVLGFAAFPWGILNFGPLYPNLAGYTMALPVSALFALFFEPGMAKRERAAVAVAFLLAALGMALTHPNVVFVVYVFMVPYVAWCAYSWAARNPRFAQKRWARFLAAALVLFAGVMLWIAAYHAPAFSGILAYKNWWAFMSKRAALANFLLLSLHETPAQPALALLVVAGCLYAFKHREFLWLVVSYCVSAVMYAANVSTDGFLKNFLTGFWYEDSYRICAMVALFALPLACLGLAWVIEWASRHVGTRHSSHGVSNAGKAACGNVLHGGMQHAGSQPLWPAVLTTCIVAVLVYFPNFTLPGVGRVETALGNAGDAVAYRNDTSRLDDALNADERAFLQEVKRVVPEGELILNHPYDGSAFAFANEDLRVYYRLLGIYNGSTRETETSKVIRNGLCNIATDAQVREAVNFTGAHYLLMLDQGDQDSEDHRRYLISYHPENWPGIESIDDETPGFEVVLSEGDMRLYRIVAQ